ncbi:somatomedin-B and thrombospondin type-1 domain-containing protein isoform X2 [Bos indicus]|uniref:Somatomedin-B and thrombospondin type-1 domain-containing protein isoform X2 n=1 Tax=Bos indicus TaxID=9915 RepID=A0ABM4TFH0_BOSIN|nr:somatomedin-B and thrombospondin type-1 domain-containing protein isoform X2 [Bos indicus x Bos taurus]
MRTLWMALCVLARLWPGALAGCADAGRCCPGRDPACFASGWRQDRVYGTCFCDQACRLTGDCCFDYARACPARPCIVGEWSPWSGCASQCRPTARVRRRAVQQEPQNGGEPCPALEERAGCLEYATPQGEDCGHAFGTALSLIAVPGCPCLYNYLCVQQGANKTGGLPTLDHKHRGRWILYGVQDRVTDSPLCPGKSPPDPMDAISPRGLHSVCGLSASSYELCEPSLFWRWLGL